ncbi:glucose-6-phosphate isomerase [Sphingomonas bacterium]|uniref:glucose-6-phosphate isomerase n=1 Tax=Sphingomonas bacterium TaxID=1895847 RepID=UPI00261481FF|nr:glucose-6-phosphate isomerase [Sphingomonas bacterium]MDB5679067.1 glucose-6-phosphate isomerase [Sphingomonas bacterium]
MADWSEIEALKRVPLTELFTADPDRLGKYSADLAGIHFDWSKTHLTDDGIKAFERLAKACDLAGKREALFTGQVINTTENRAVTHTAERGEGAKDDVAVAQGFHARMRGLIDVIESGALGPIRNVLHVGIGGSALGPDLLVDALGRDAARYEVAIVSNVDGVALEDVFKRFDPTATLLAVASKTFTTTETMLNAESVIEWMQAGGVEDPYGRVIALTAEPDKAIEWGVDETRVLPFADTVGGRYSLWSSIGFPAAIALGWDAFSDLLEGAAEVDRHFRLTALHENVPAIAAFSDLLYTQVLGCETRGVFCYDERLRLLPSYLQQLEMESNGKGVTLDGQPVGRPTAAITWGGVGTDAQHAVFQLLHQGTHLVPLELIGVIEPGDTLAEDHHKNLLNNMFAQGAALMKGKPNPDDPARAYPGDRPSTTLLLDDLDARTLGALIAYHEHRVFVNGVLLGINSFDQFGVELGKEMAKAASKGEGDFDPSTTDLIKRAFG